MNRPSLSRFSTPARLKAAERREEETGGEGLRRIGGRTKCRASLRYNLLSRRLQLTSLDDVTFRSRLISNRAV